MALRALLNGLRWFLLASGLALIWAGASVTSLGLSVALLIPGLALLAVGMLMMWWYVRPNASRVEPRLAIETWDVIADHLHHSNTDLLHWQGRFYLVHATSPYHLASQRCHLSLLASEDGLHWQRLHAFDIPGEDIRDPKLAAIGGRLILYALANRSWDPEPYGTVLSTSDDRGRTWTPFRPLGLDGWLLWKPKTRDGRTWYAGGYWNEHGRSALFSSQDGLAWRRVTAIFEGGRRNDETDIEFLPDGSLIATARLEGEFAEWSYSMFFGDPGGGTLVATSDAPYEHFNPSAFSQLTRLDGPALFAHGGRTFAVGRFQPDHDRFFRRQGSLFARKRTSLFEVTPQGLTWLSDVPSAGDTSYAGVVPRGGEVYVCYYTSPIDGDVPWIVGMLNRTAIRMARINLASLLDLAEARQLQPIP